MARLGLAVSRKTSKRAVIRNRLKRSVRESFRQRRHALPVVDILVIAHAAAVGASSTQLRQELDQHWAQLDQRYTVASTQPPGQRSSSSVKADKDTNLT